MVAFIFSRQKCDTNAEMLVNLDLTTEKEKSHIEQFFKKCVRYGINVDRMVLK